MLFIRTQSDVLFFALILSRTIVVHYQTLQSYQWHILFMWFISNTGNQNTKCLGESLNFPNLRDLNNLSKQFDIHVTLITLLSLCQPTIYEKILLSSSLSCNDIQYYLHVTQCFTFGLAISHVISITFCVNYNAIF